MSPHSAIPAPPEPRSVPRVRVPRASSTRDAEGRRHDVLSVARLQGDLVLRLDSTPGGPSPPLRAEAVPAIGFRMGQNHLVTVEREEDLVGLQRVGRLVRLTLEVTTGSLEPGMTTSELDRAARY